MMIWFCHIDTLLLFCSIWDVDTSKEKHKLNGPQKVTSVAISADGKTIVSGLADCTVR